MEGTRQVVDFDGSFINWKVRKFFNALVCAECAITKHDKDTGTKEEYLVGSGVLACHVINSERMFIEPTYFFQPFLSEKQFKIFRFGSAAAQNEYGLVSHKFDAAGIQIKRIGGRKLANGEAVIEAIDQCREILVAIRIAAGQGCDYVIEFKGKHVYYHADSRRFQIEAGPIALPVDFMNIDSLESWQLCYVAFNTFERIEYCVNDGSGSKSKEYGPILTLQTQIELYTPL